MKKIATCISYCIIITLIYSFDSLFFAVPPFFNRIDHLREFVFKSRVQYAIKINLKIVSSNLMRLPGNQHLNLHVMFYNVPTQTKQCKCHVSIFRTAESDFGNAIKIFHYEEVNYKIQAFLENEYDFKAKEDYIPVEFLREKNFVFEWEFLCFSLSILEFTFVLRELLLTPNMSFDCEGTYFLTSNFKINFGNRLSVTYVFQIVTRKNAVRP